MSQTDVLVTEDHLCVVTDNIGRDWRDLGNRLKVGYANLECIAHDRSADGAKAMMNETLQFWMRKNDDKATLSVLLQCLEGMGRMDICRKLKSIPTGESSGSLQAKMTTAQETKQGPSSITERKVLPKHKVLVAKKIGKHWRELGGELGFSRGELDNFAYDNTIRESCRDMLDEWVEAKTPKLSDLVNALRTCDKNEIANELELGD